MSAVDGDLAYGFLSPGPREIASRLKEMIEETVGELRHDCFYLHLGCVTDSDVVVSFLRITLCPYLHVPRYSKEGNLG
jgi:hypothetical protein